MATNPGYYIPFCAVCEYRVSEHFILSLHSFSLDFKSKSVVKVQNVR